MKKIILVMVGTMFWMPVYATTMCAINDSVAVVLDPTIGGTSYGSDSTIGTWWTQFPYGRILGISACIDTDHGKGMGGTVAKLTDSNGNRVKGNEKNGRYCWCKITHPVSSLWAHNNDSVGFDLSSDAKCAAWCKSSCAYVLRNNNTGLRAGLFGLNQ